MVDISDGAIVGAGTVVVRAVLAGATVVGNPVGILDNLSNDGMTIG